MTATVGTVLAPEVAAAVAAITAAPGAWCPSLSPDGTAVAYICDRSGLPRVEVASLDADDARTVSGPEQEAISVAWSPDCARLLYLVSPAGSIRAQLHTVAPDGTNRRLLAGGGRETVFAGAFLPDGRYACSIADGIGPGTKVVVVDPSTGTVVQVPAADRLGFTVVTSVSPDGDRLVVRSGPRNQRALYLVPLTDGPVTPLVTMPGDDGGPVGRAAEDGRFSGPDRIHLRSHLAGDSIGFFRVELDRRGVPGEPAPLAVARHDLEAYALRPGGESMLAVWNVDGRSRPDLRWIGEPTTDAPPVVIDLPQPVMPGWGLSADGRVLIAELTGPDAPRALYRLDLPPDNDVRDGRKSYERTTTAARLPAMPRVALPGLVHPELVRYPSSDGLELTGWLYRVPGRTGPGPTVVSFHGGPESQERPAFAQVAQALVVAGCAVFAPNVRGSSGSGLAFMSADDGPARESSFADIPATVNFLAGSGVADRDRVGAYGWSYGGYLTLNALVRWPELFRAGVSLAGMSDLRTFFADTEPWMAAASVTEYGDPTTDGDLLASLSPLPGFDRIASPVLLVHGEADTNVPVSESVRAHRRLRDLGSPVELMLLPGEGHTIVGSDNRTAVALTVVDWFTRWLTTRARP